MIGQSNSISNINKDWSVFLDRDGVINKRIIGGYITKASDLELLAGVEEALRIFSEIFNHIVIVTNQQGIGKGIMTVDDLKEVHNALTEKIIKHGGRIDNIYYSPHLKSENSFLRKPNIGMGLLAKRDFRDINFRKSIMAGDSISDMQFGKRLGMTTIFISSNIDEARQNSRFINYLFPDLISFAESLNRI